MQQYILRCIGGIVILAMYYANMSWTAFMPINTSSAFSNTAAVYNSSRILNKDNSFNTTAYHNYSPPYLSAAALFKTGGEFAFYTITLCYVFIRYWHPIYKAFSGVYQNIRHRRSDMDGFEDAHTRMMRSYPEVPEWWFLIVLLIGFAITVVTLEHFPTDTPFWSIFAFVGIGYFLLVPWCIIESIAATGIGFDTMWHLLPGLWWPGKLVPHLVIVMLGSAFEYQAGGFMIDLKYCQYAHIPPRAVFRGHIVSTVVNVLFYVIIIDWLVTGYSPATFCNMDDPQRMVCQNPRSVWTQTIFYGIFGTTKLFKMYPILPWCFLIGAIIGITWGIVELNAPSFMRHLKTRMSEKSFHAFEKYFWNPAAMVLCYINPAIALSGMLNWSAQNNLSMYTTGIYLAWYFQYYLKRYKTAWWSKYAYIMFAGISVGITISGLISTLSFGFGSGLGKSLKWWGNHASVNTINYKAYTDKKEGVRLQVPKDRGYFGLDSTNYP